MEPDPDYDEDILPEPQADYFEHPAVRKSSFNPNGYNNINNNNNNQSFLNMNTAAATAFMTPNPFLLPPGVVVSQTNGQQSEITQSQLRPLQSLDARVLKQFRALEQKDPRFKRRVIRNSHTANTIASGGVSSVPGANFMTRFISPGGTEYNYSQI